MDLSLLLLAELGKRRAVLVAAAEILHAAVFRICCQLPAGLGVENVVFLGKIGVFHPAHQRVLVVSEMEDLPVTVVPRLKISGPHFHHVDVTVSYAHSAREDALGGFENDLVFVLQGPHLFREISVLKFGDVGAHDR